MTRQLTWDEACTNAYSGAIRNDQNDERVARVVLAVYPSYDDDDLETAARDVLTDLRHLCDLMGWSIADLDQDAHRTYQRELGECGIAKNDTLKAALERDLT